jgi:hypothetical protein
MRTYGPLVIAAMVALGLTVAAVGVVRQDASIPKTGWPIVVYAHLDYPTPAHCPGVVRDGHCYIP